jgi:hypothetical protein
MVVFIVENCCSVEVVCSTILFLIIRITLINKPFFISVVIGGPDARICVVVRISEEVVSPKMKDNNHFVNYKNRSTNINFHKFFYL